MGKHICGACGKKFTNEAAYNGHTCEKTGLVANSIEHQDALSGGAASRIAEAALARGADRE